MERKLIGIIFALACFCNAFVAVGEIIQVSTGEKFWDAIYNHIEDSEVVIQLTDTIDMKDVYNSEQYNTTIDHPFMGTIDGYYTNTDGIICSHVIKNVDFALVANMEGAKVRGVIFMDCNTSGYLNYYPAIIAAKARQCEFTELLFENCRYDDGIMGEVGAYIKSGYGLMVDELYDCDVNKVGFVGCSIKKYGSKVGSVAGYAENSTLTDCWTEHFSHFFAESTNAYIGGLVGEASHCSFTSCVNMASVSGSEKADNVGGITGKSTQCDFVGCSNSGTLTQLSRTAWAYYSRMQTKAIDNLTQTFGKYILNYQVSDAVYRNYHMATDNISQMSFDEALNYFDKWFESVQDYHKFHQTQRGACLMALVSLAIQIYSEISEANEPDEMGGISAASYGCTFNRCLNAGIIYCRDAYGGGIVGKAGTDNGVRTQIKHCVNRAYVQGDEQTGGIVGYLDSNSIVYYCLNTGAVDVIKETRGPIYGQCDGSSQNVKCNFALVHDAEFAPGVSGSSPVYYVSLQDVKGGLAASELNRLGGNYFCQNIGVNACPIFEGMFVTASDIRDDVDLHYEVSTKDEFLLALYDQYADIRLTDDIDFGNEYVTVYRRFTPFRGSIDGQGYAFVNIRVVQDGRIDGYNNKWDALLGEYKNSAMIGGAENATFKNIDFENMSVKLPGIASGFVGNSRSCTYENVRLKRNSRVAGAGNGVGGIVCHSFNDKFISCVIDSTSIVKADMGGDGIANPLWDDMVGGLVSKAVGSSFYRCVNFGEVSSLRDGAAGIVAEAEDCVLQYCFNRGYVHHSASYVIYNDYLGGIAAKATNTNFDLCVNSGRLFCEDEYGGGIVGYGTKVTLNNCLSSSQQLSFSDNTCGSIIGVAKDSRVTNCFANVDSPMIGKVSGDMDAASGNNYRLRDKDTSMNIYEMGVDAEKIASGIVTYWLNNNTDNRYLENQPWLQNLPQMEDIFVDAHPMVETSHLKVTIDDLPVTVITSADELKAFAEKVNNGDQYACAVLDADIDMSGCSWSPIGIDSHRFRGLFDGRGHTISGLTCSVSGSSSDNKGAGLFGVVDVFADINNVVIGQGSEITSTLDKGAAGIVGLVKSENRQWGNVHISNCGSYASVSATKHAGGILGRIITDDQMGDAVKVIVSNCFNVGNITASDANSALLCGYMKNMGVVRNCWGAGLLSNPDSRYGAYNIVNPNNEAEYLVGYDKTLDIHDCYIINPAGNIDKYGENPLQNGVKIISNESASSGEFAYMLNKGVVDGTQEWYQKIGTDPYPLRTKLSDGTNMVFSYDVEVGTRYANTSREEISYVILSNDTNDAHRVTDIDKTAETNVADLLKFISTAYRKMTTNNSR